MINGGYAMRTNFQMVRDLFKKYQPAQRGIISGSEVAMIKEELCVAEMDILQLRNLRDFVVMYSSNSIKNDSSIEEEMAMMDRCSGICSVIDEEIFGKGGEV